jgi:glutamate synthase domain-containing protein 1
MQKQGLYDPANEHDACGVGFVANIRGEKSHDVVAKGIQVLINLEHRGACGCDPETGDGAGFLVQIPDVFLRREMKAQGIELPEPGRYAVAMAFLAQDAAASARQIGRSAGSLARACRAYDSCSSPPQVAMPSTRTRSSASST